jgi:3-phosphoshikimate 1-carboxyvinyltransferase
VADARFEPSGPLRGTLRPPPDKSISHRAAIIAAMSEGQSRLANYLDSADTRSTLGAISALGAEVSTGEPLDGGVEVLVQGAGLRGAREAAIDVGNAGTLLRLLPGWLAGQGRGRWELDGDQSIRQRPVDRVAEPLRAMGATVECRDGRLPPLRVTAARLRGLRYELPVASAQVKSCVLLAGLLAAGETTVVEPVPTRDHTERMLEVSGAALELGQDDHGARTVTVRGIGRLEPGLTRVPGDFSAAAFALVAATVVPGSELRIDDVGLNPTRTGLLPILSRMAAAIEVQSDREDGEEPVGRVAIRSAPLRGTEAQGGEIPLAIDELPLVALAACFADGETVIRDAGELRHKESDRIAAVAGALNAIGGEVEPTEDGMVIRGTGGLRGGTVDSRGDHRLAMMGAVAGLASREGVTVRGMEAAAVSYPSFERDLAALLA